MALILRSCKKHYLVKSLHSLFRHHNAVYCLTVSKSSVVNHQQSAQRGVRGGRPSLYGSIAIRTVCNIVNKFHFRVTFVAKANCTE